MKIKQSGLAVCLTAILTGCGGGSDGYYSESNDKNNTPVIHPIQI